MIAATHDVILLNKRLDKETRRDVYTATLISGVSVYNRTQSTSDNTFHELAEKYKIRIPITAVIPSNKTYLPKSQYDKLTSLQAKEYWTLQAEDLIIVCDSEHIDASFFESAITQQQAEETASSYGLFDTPICIIDFSDNTMRGSTRTKHWRIGGA